jgi:UDP-N-acetylmuramate--alanine ligase
VIALENPESLAGLIAGLAKPDDFVVCLGAGSITTWANALPGELEKLGKTAEKAASSKPKKGKGK